MLTGGNMMKVEFNLHFVGLEMVKVGDRLTALT